MSWKNNLPNLRNSPLNNKHLSFHKHSYRIGYSKPNLNNEPRNPFPKCIKQLHVHPVARRIICRKKSVDPALHKSQLLDPLRPDCQHRLAHHLNNLQNPTSFQRHNFNCQDPYWRRRRCKLTGNGAV
jgi:hypothetical protein